MVLRCPLDALALGLPFRCKVSHHLQTAPFYLAPVTEWYANVSLSGCEVAQRGQDEIRGQLQLVLCMLPLSERYGLCRGQMQFVSEIKENLKHEAGEAICMEKPLDMAWVGCQVEWGKVSGNH